ncbi:very short patch repair endonuclease [Hyphomicrobium sp. 1Nfss2.1]|uniref:very short patch repair endonuclease n=1 Tax=Hyphomicrobium sp. 1Nfss2.1 TaxID=3413936 RepID=UPI003C7EA49B
MERFARIMDIVAPSDRSRMMARIRGKSTKPELIVRRTAHQLGYRFRLHRKQLPGTPDLSFPRLRLAVFVNGCFWHRHPNCRYAYTPKSNIDFWTRKFSNNVQRDIRAKEQLESMGWRVAVIWECETADSLALRDTLSTILAP